MKTYKVTVAFMLHNDISTKITHLHGGDLFVLLAKTFFTSKLKEFARAKKTPHAEHIMEEFKTFIDRDSKNKDIVTKHNEATVIIEQ